MTQAWKDLSASRPTSLFCLYASYCRPTVSRCRIRFATCHCACGIVCVCRMHGNDVWRSGVNSFRRDMCVLHIYAEIYGARGIVGTAVSIQYSRSRFTAREMAPAFSHHRFTVLLDSDLRQGKIPCTRDSNFAGDSSLSQETANSRCLWSTRHLDFLSRIGTSFGGWRCGSSPQTPCARPWRMAHLALSLGVPRTPHRRFATVRSSLYSRHEREVIDPPPH